MRVGRRDPIERAFNQKLNRNTLFPKDESIKQAQTIFERREYWTWTVSMIEYEIVQSGLFQEHLEPGGHVSYSEFKRIIDQLLNRMIKYENSVY